MIYWDHSIRSTGCHCKLQQHRTINYIYNKINSFHHRAAAAEKNMDDNADSWSCHVETDVSERGLLSTAASSFLMDDVDDGDEDATTSNNNNSMNQGENDQDDDNDVSRLHHHRSLVEAVDGAVSNNNTDDDDWSRQVEADPETALLHRTPSSVLDDQEITIVASTTVANASAATTTGSSTTVAALDEGGSLAASVAPPMREEPTLKEKLVERERQRRVETERARLKRQFALRNGEHSEGSLIEECEDLEDGFSGHENMMGENGSVAGTVGEGSIVAPVDVLLEDDQHKLLNYTMERFLQEQGTIMEEEVAWEPSSGIKRDAQNQGVVMERFLQEKVLVERSSSREAGDDDLHHPSQVDRSVSFDMDPPQYPTPGSPLRDDESSQKGMTTPPCSVSRTDFDATPGNGYDADGSMGVNTPREGSSYLGSASLDCITSDVARISDLGRPGISTLDETADGDLMQPSLREHSVDVLPPESPTIDQPRVLGLTPLRKSVSRTPLLRNVMTCPPLPLWQSSYRTLAVKGWTMEEEQP